MKLKYISYHSMLSPPVMLLPEIKPHCLSWLQSNQSLLGSSIFLVGKLHPGSPVQYTSGCNTTGLPQGHPITLGELHAGSSRPSIQSDYSMWPNILASFSDHHLSTGSGSPVRCEYSIRQIHLKANGMRFGKWYMPVMLMLLLNVSTVCSQY